MARIRLDPEQLQASARQIWQLAHRIDQIKNNIRSAYHNLSCEDLDYRSRARIESKVRNASRLGGVLESEIQNLARQLERIADRFVDADRQYSDFLSRITNQLKESYSGGLLPIGMGLAGLTGLFAIGQTAGRGIGEELYWIETGNKLSFLDRATGKGLKYLRDAPLTNYQSWGRSINENWAKNVRGGWIGWMDSAGHVIKPAAIIGVPIVSGLFAFAKDDDPDRTRAAGTATAETLIEVGIHAAGDLVLAADSSVQLFGDLAEEGAKMAGRTYGGEWEEIFYQQAYSLNDNYDRIYLGNIKQDVAHIAVDRFFAAIGKPGAKEQTGQDLSDLWGHVSDIPGGLFDTGGDTVDTFKLSTIASLDKGMSVLPVPPELKNRFHAACLDKGQMIADADQVRDKGMIDFFSSDGMEGITGVVH